MSWRRIRTDFRFAIVTLFSVITVLGVTPFAIYRFARGQWLAGVVDVAIIVFLMASGVHVWRGGNIERASRVIVAASGVGCLLVANLVGLAGVLWTYPILLANFMLVERRVATLASTTTILAMLLSPGIFADATQHTLFLVTALVTSMFAFIFAYRTDSQRVQLEDLACIDPLTGIYNRRAMERELAIAIELYRRYRTPYGLALADLDHFKHINDAFGHEAGDRTLVDFTKVVLRNTRKGDRFFRFGGEEFVLLLPGTDSASLQIFCDHLRGRIAAEVHCDSQSVPVSIGAAVLETDEDAASWLARADEAVYQAAKKRGRDHVVVHPGRGVQAKSLTGSTPRRHA